MLQVMDILEFQTINKSYRCVEVETRPLNTFKSKVYLKEKAKKAIYESKYAGPEEILKAVDTHEEMPGLLWADTRNDWLRYMKWKPSFFKNTPYIFFLMNHRQFPVDTRKLFWTKPNKQGKKISIYRQQVLHGWASFHERKLYDKYNKQYIVMNDGSLWKKVYQKARYWKTYNSLNFDIDLRERTLQD
jgi:hypothetical protein